MYRDQFRSVVEDAVRKSLAEGNVDVSAMPPQQLQALIAAIADGVFAGLEATLDENMTGFDTAAMPEKSDLAAAAAAATAVAAAQDDALKTPAAEVEVPKEMQRAAVAAAAVPPASFTQEKLLWRGRPYLTVGTIYELTTQRLRVIRGIVGNQIEEIELVRVRDTRVSQTAGERMFDIGDITIVSSDATTPEKILWNVRDPLQVRELIRKAVLVERDRRKMIYREEMHDDAHDETTDGIGDTNL
jgi:hypothetical protein